MSAKIAAITIANASLTSAGLARYDDLVTLLRTAENKLEAMQAYHGGTAAASIEAFRSKISAALEGVPYP